MRFEANVYIDATPQAVWDAVADPEEWPRWTRAVYRVKKLSEGPLGVGSRLRAIIMCIVPLPQYMTVTEFVPGNRVTMEGSTLLARATRYFVLRAEGNRTRAIAGGEARGPLAALTWLTGQVLSHEIVQEMKMKIEG